RRPFSEASLNRATALIRMPCRHTLKKLNSSVLLLFAESNYMKGKMQKQSSSRSTDSSLDQGLELKNLKEKYDDVDEVPHNHHGYSWMICTVLIVGITAGGGMV
ncbi:hypothetical protein PENTCL1PPCAC_15322, partial [Pristionchus entomophagus]